jgi:hypothetical protein
VNGAQEKNLVILKSYNADRKMTYQSPDTDKLGYRLKSYNLYEAMPHGICAGYLTISVHRSHVRSCTTCSNQTSFSSVVAICTLWSLGLTFTLKKFAYNIIWSMLSISSLGVYLLLELKLFIIVNRYCNLLVKIDLSNFRIPYQCSGEFNIFCLVILKGCLCQYIWNIESVAYVMLVSDLYLP